MPRILVTGSRTWYDPTVIQRELRKAWMDLGATPDCTLVSGACPDGADSIAERLWGQAGLPIERHPAKWLEHGKAAGPIRNQHMVDLGADLCVAFIRADSRGATHTANAAIEAGIDTRIFRDGSPPRPMVEAAATWWTEQVIGL